MVVYVVPEINCRRRFLLLVEPTCMSIILSNKKLSSVEH